MDNSDDLEYRWTNDRWETSSDYPYLWERMNPDSAVKSVRSDYLIPRPDGRFFEQRTITVESPGCPGEGAGVRSLPISVTPAPPPPPN